MRILVITYAFVPLQYPATYRLLKWFKGLGERGHFVTVLSVHPNSFNGIKDDSLNQLVSPSTRTIKVRSPENSLLFRGLGLYKSWFYRLFEPRKMEWYSSCKRALGTLDFEDYDVILSCSQPPVGHLLGLYAKERSNLPWVAYFSDPWVNSPFQSYRSQRAKCYNIGLKQTVVRSSDRLVFPSPEVRDRVLEGHSAEDREKCVLLPHCYVPSWYELNPKETKTKSRKLNVLVTGSFYGPRTPIPFLSILRDIKKVADLTGRLKVEIYGFISDELRQNSLWSELEDVVQFKGAIDYLSSLAKMKQADHLLLIDAETQDEGSIFFPSKLADYLGSGTPIVGLTPSSGVSARVLRETGNVACSISDKEGVRTTITDMISGNSGARTDGSERKRYDYRIVTEQLEKILTRA